MLSVQEKYHTMYALLNEKQWRQYLATEAQEKANVALVARDAHVAINTIRRGVQELACGDHYTPGSRVRAVGAGRRRIVDTDETFVTDLDSLLEPKGDPMTHLRWTTKSLAHLVSALADRQHTIHMSALGAYLRSEHFSLKGNKKNIEGTSHPDRDHQFHHINHICATFEASGNPIISVDCKKKELIGNFKNNGREWQPRGTETIVNAYDFVNLADGKAVPYGIYDVVHNKGFVNVGVDHDTAEFAVESIRRWWKAVGQILYPHQKELLITADGGGSNASRSRLWKKELQTLANQTHLTITVCHYPPATSKWNRIEHRLFSFISINWRAKPLTSLETVIELISHTTTQQGLTVTAVKDDHCYATGKKVTDDELAMLNLRTDPFHGDWNYTIAPQSPLCIESTN